MLGWAFFILPIAHTHVLVFRTGMCFLMWNFSHMWISSDVWMLFHVFCQSSVYFHSDNYPYLITRLCHCSLWGSLIPLFLSPLRGHGAAVGLCSDMDLQGVWLCTSPLQSYADTFYLFGHPAIYIARTEPQAPIKMVTLTIYCLKDKLGILCACGNYPQAAEGL